MNVDIYKLRQILSEAMDGDWGDDDPQASTEVESGEMEIEDEAGFSEWASKVIVSDYLSEYGLERPQQIPFYVDEEYNPVHNAYDAFREGMSPEAYAIKLAFLINVYGVELGRENVIRGNFDDYSLQAQFEDTLSGEELEAIGSDYDEAGDTLQPQERGSLPRPSEELSENDLAAMSVQEYAEMVNAESAAEMEATPDLYIGSYSVDPNYWEAQRQQWEDWGWENNPYVNALAFVRSQLIGDISESFKGYRYSKRIHPEEMAAFRAMNLDQLRLAAEGHAEKAHEEYQAQQAEEEESAVWAEYDKEFMDQAFADIAAADDADAAKYAETERMYTPEVGEDLPQSLGPGRRMRRGGRTGAGKLRESVIKRWGLIAGIKD